MSDTARKSMASLQALRAFATLIVVCFHLSGGMALPKYFGASAVGNMFAFGHAGVDLFFVLSGFLIFSIHRMDFGQPARFGRYARKRLIRIYPSYWIVLTVVAAMILAEKPAIDGILNWVGLVKTILLVPQDVRVIGGVGSPILIVAWSLQYEMCFYVAIGLFILSRPVGALVLLALFATAWSDTDSFLARFMLDPRAGQFVLGIVAALLLPRVARRLGVALAALGASVFAVAATLEVLDLLSRDHHPLLHPLTFGLASASLLVGLVRMEHEGLLKVPSLLVHLGDSSYATYLIHFTLISVLCRLCSRIFPHTGVGLLAFYVFAVAACLAVGHAYYVWVESPVIRWLTARSAVRSAPISKTLVSE